MRLMWSLPGVSLFGVCLFLAMGCQATSGVSIDVSTDLTPFEDFDTVRISIDGAMDALPAYAGDRFLPAPRRFGGYSVSAGERHTFEVELVKSGRVILGRSVSLVVPSGAVVPFFLLRSCLNVRCPGAGDPEATECDDGRCVPPTCAFDDCIMDTCVIASCPAPAASCAAADCVANRCVLVPRAGVCASAEYCDPVRGCLPRTVDGADAGSADAGPRPDGGCTSDAHCAPPSYGTWSDCTYADTCTTSGSMRSRSVTSERCLAGRCVASDATETETCMRMTDGAPCGAEVDGPPSPCCSGMSTFTRTTPICAGGSCSSSMSMPITVPGCGSPTEICNLIDDDCDGSCDPGCRVGVARFLRTALGDHLFTRNPAEAGGLGYDNYKNPSAFMVSDTDAPGMLPLNRCRVGGFYLYTTTTDCEGIGGATPDARLGYVAATPVCGSTALYQLSFAGHWFLTVGMSEATTAVANGWTLHGTIGYAWY